MTTTGPIRVIIVDDHAMLRRGLRFFLSSFEDLELVGEASGGKEALTLCAEVEPDVVLMDMVMAEMDGAETTRIIREKYPRVQVIAEAIAALVSADHLMISGFLPHDSIIPYEERLTYVRVEDS